MSMMVLPYIMFMLSMIGMMLNSSNFLLILICMEIMLLSMIMNFIFYSIIFNSMLGEIFSMYIMTVAAVETAIGLSLLMVFYKLKGSMSMKLLNLLKG